MLSWDFERYNVDGDNYLLSTGQPLGFNSLVSVVDESRNTQYVSKELNCTSEDIMYTQLLPDGYGSVPDVVDGVSIKTMSDIFVAANKGDNQRLQESISELVEEELNPSEMAADGGAETSGREMSDSEKARLKLRYLDHQITTDDI